MCKEQNEFCPCASVKNGIWCHRPMMAIINATKILSSLAKIGAQLTRNTKFAMIVFVLGVGRRRHLSCHGTKGFHGHSIVNHSDVASFTFRMQMVCGVNFKAASFFQAAAFVFTISCKSSKTGGSAAPNTLTKAEVK